MIRYELIDRFFSFNLCRCSCRSAQHLYILNSRLNFIFFVSFLNNIWVCVVSFLQQASFLFHFHGSMNSKILASRSSLSSDIWLICIGIFITDVNPYYAYIFHSYIHIYLPLLTMPWIVTSRWGMIYCVIERNHSYTWWSVCQEEEMVE